MFKDISKQDLVNVDSILTEGKARINSIPPNLKRVQSADVTRRVHDAVIEYRLKQYLTEAESTIAKGEAEISPKLPKSKRAELANLICDAYDLRADLMRLLKRWTDLGL